MTTNARSIVDAGKRETGVLARAAPAAAEQRIEVDLAARRHRLGERHRRATTSGSTSPTAPTSMPSTTIAAHARPGGSRGRVGLTSRKSASRSSTAERFDDRGEVVDGRRRGRARAARARTRPVAATARGAAARRAACSRLGRRRTPGPARTATTSGLPCASLCATARSTPGSSDGRRTDSSARNGFSTSMTASAASPALREIGRREQRQRVHLVVARRRRARRRPGGVRAARRSGRRSSSGSSGPCA